MSQRGSSIIAEGDTEKITITGSGFGNAPNGTTYPVGCRATYSNYTNEALVFQDKSTDGLTWSAGSESTCTGLDLVSYSDTEVSYEFGSYYGSNSKYTRDVLDYLTVTINGIQCSEFYNPG